MKQSIGFALALLVAARLAAGAAAGEAVTIARSEQLVFDSAAVKDRYLLQIRYPETYATSTKRYPLVVVLDADVWFGLVADLIDNYGATQEIPECLLVGVAYGGDLGNWWQKRARDYTLALHSGEKHDDLRLAGGGERNSSSFSTGSCGLGPRRSLANGSANGC